MQSAENLSALRQKIVFSFTVFLPHVALIYALLYELNSPSLKWGLLSLVILFVATGFGIEAGFHRMLTHRAFQTPTFMKVILVALGSMAAQGPVLAWVAIHRRHHMFSDSEGDPHSPMPSGPGVWNYIKGIYHAHFGWFFCVGQPNVFRYAPDLLMDRALVVLNQSYWFLVGFGILLPGVLLGLILESWDGFVSGVLWGGLIRVCLTHNAMGSVNSICHRQGMAVNNHWLAIPTLGSSLHKNHHASPPRTSTSLAWWQLDLSGVFLRIFKAVGLVSYT